MSFPRYPQYTDSLGSLAVELPSDWYCKRLKRLARLITEKATERTNTIALEHLEAWTGKRIPSEVDYAGDGTSFVAGDILFGKLRPYLAKVYLAIEPGEAIGDFHVLRPDPEWLPAFGRYQLLNRQFINAVDGASYGSKMPRAGWDFMGSLSMPVPPEKDQFAIISFLDCETAKIDTLVAEQRRLMELLKEKRQAVISHAVTKGLNPAAPMKPSGIEWLGDVPAHWEVTRVKRLASSIEQGWSPQCEGFAVESEREWGILKVGCVNEGRFDPAENKALPAGLEPIPELGIAAGDLLISRANTRERVGSAALVERDYPRLMLCDKLFRLRINACCSDARFVAQYLSSSAVRGRFELEATGASASMVNISQSSILDLSIAVPSPQEASQIAARVSGMLVQLDTLAAEAQRAVDLLQERRSALISAAVTGQIDVRGLVASEVT